MRTELDFDDFNKNKGYKNRLSVNVAFSVLKEIGYRLYLGDLCYGEEEGNTAWGAYCEYVQREDKAQFMLDFNEDFVYPKRDDLLNFTTLDRKSIFRYYQNTAPEELMNWLEEHGG